MRLLRRLIILVCLVAAGALLVSYYGWPQQRLSLALDQLIGLQDRRSGENVSTESLPSYAKDVAGKAWFQRYFLRLAFSDEEGADSYTGQITKWSKRRVKIDVLNNGGPGMDEYVSQLVARLNRMQSATKFSVVDGPADVTIEYLSHAAYALAVGDGSVGNCETRFFGGGPGLVSATIKVDAGVLRSVEDRQPVVIHELTHAIGLKGHFHTPQDRTRSVLYYAAAISSWSQNDAAVIRILYSSGIRNGMNPPAVRKALRTIGQP